MFDAIVSYCDNVENPCLCRGIKVMNVASVVVFK